MANKENLQYHINCGSGDIGGYCLLPGDPGRSELIAAHFDSPRKVGHNREYVTYTGWLCGREVTVCSTGIGGPSAVIAMEELCKLGAHTFIRVGTCGGISLEVDGGDLIVASGAVRQDGTSKEYAPPEFPAVADFKVTAALAESAARIRRCHVGIVQSKDSFYGQHDPARMPVAAALLNKWEAWKRLGVLASEMEAAPLFVAASALKVRCGAVLMAVWNQERRLAGLPSVEAHDTGEVIEAAIDAIKILIAAEE